LGSVLLNMKIELCLHLGLISSIFVSYLVDCFRKWRNGCPGALNPLVRLSDHVIDRHYSETVQRVETINEPDSNGVLKDTHEKMAEYIELLLRIKENDELSQIRTMKYYARYCLLFLVSIQCLLFFRFVSHSHFIYTVMTLICSVTAVIYFSFLVFRLLRTSKRKNLIRLSALTFAWAILSFVCFVMLQMHPSTDLVLK